MKKLEKIFRQIMQDLGIDKVTKALSDIQNLQLNLYRVSLSLAVGATTENNEFTISEKIRKLTFKQLIGVHEDFLSDLVDGEFQSEKIMEVKCEQTTKH